MISGMDFDAFLSSPAPPRRQSPPTCISDDARKDNRQAGTPRKPQHRVHARAIPRTLASSFDFVRIGFCPAISSTATSFSPVPSAFGRNSCSGGSIRRTVTGKPVHRAENADESLRAESASSSSRADWRSAFVAPPESCGAQSADGLLPGTYVRCGTARCRTAPSANRLAAACSGVSALARTAQYSRELVGPAH